MRRAQSGLPAGTRNLPHSSDRGTLVAVAPPHGFHLGARMPWLIIILSVALYLGTLRYGFVWDDLALIALNQFVRRLADLPSWLSMTAEQVSFGHFSGNLYRPGVLVSLALDFSLWGDGATGFHLTTSCSTASWCGWFFGWSKPSAGARIWRWWWPSSLRSTQRTWKMWPGFRHAGISGSRSAW